LREFVRGQENHMRQPRDLPQAILSVCLVLLVSPVAAPAQTAPASQSTSAPMDTPPAALPSRAASPVAPALTAKDIQGLDVFGSDGQQVGKIAKVNVTDGTVREVVVQSIGFLGFFSKTYLLPAEKLNKKGGRVELSMTSEQAKQFVK
jgi:sporulation protein YlmC with PRC-barrel domain